MNNFRACELRHTEATHADRFMRVIWAGTRCHTYLGDRNGINDTSVQAFRSRREAEKSFNRVWDHNTGGYTYGIAYLSQAQRVSRKALADPLSTMAALWTADVVAWLQGGEQTRRSWVYVDGLAKAAAHDTGARAALEYFLAGPHYHDLAQDRIIAQAGIITPGAVFERADPPEAGRLGMSRAVTVLAPIHGCDHNPTPCPPCTERLPELLAFQLRGHDPVTLPYTTRMRMANAARSMTHLARPPFATSRA